jgi:hypothetical protein
MGTQRLRLEYTDRRHWRLTEIEHGALPSAAGSSWTFAGDRVIVHNAVRGVDSVTPYGPTEETVPTNWLVPGKTFWMAQRPTYKVTKIANGLAVLGHDELITTAPSAPGTPPITVAPRTFHEEITYREADGIPTGLVETLDGVVIRRIDVESFSLTRP